MKYCGSLLILIFLSQKISAQNLILDQIAEQNKKNALSASFVTDYRFKYPTSTVEEYKAAGQLTFESCEKFEEVSVKISFAKEAEKKSTPKQICNCLMRNIAPAQDIQEARVLKAYFSSEQLPSSVFEGSAEIQDVFDERPDYIQHANTLLLKCEKDADYQDLEN